MIGIFISFRFRALQEAQDIFGVDFDFEDIQQYDEYDEDFDEDVPALLLFSLLRIHSSFHDYY